MASIKYVDRIITLRSIIRELKQAMKGVGYSDRFSRDPSISHVFDLFRANQVTEKRFCRPEDHYKYFAETYLTYLRSNRLRGEITEKYFTKRERSIEESAKLVGLELPK